MTVHAYKLKKLHLLSIAVLFGTLGLITLISTLAASPSATIEPETATLSSGAKQVTDTNASNSKALKFGAVVATPPPPTPPVTGTIYGWQRTASNTGLASVGIDRNTLPIYNGPFTSGMTITNKKIVGSRDFSGANNITFDGCWFVGSGGASDQLFLGYNSGFTIKNSDITQTGTLTGTVVDIRGYGPTNYKIQNVYINAGTVGIWIDGSGTGSIEDSYVRIDQSGGDGHRDGITRREGTGTQSIVRTRVYTNVPGGTTGPFFLQAFTDPIGGVTLTDSMFEGIGYLITLDPRPDSISLAVNNVRLNLLGQYGLTTVGPGTGPLTVSQWNKVYTYNASAPDDADGGGKGTLVSQPH